MVKIPSPLSPELKQSAFTIHTGARFGLTPRAAQHRRFVAPHYGVRRLDQLTPEHEFIEVRAKRLAADYLPILRPGEAFSHTLALLLLGVPVHVTPRLHVTAPISLAQARGRNVQGHRRRAPFVPVIAHSALPCVPHLTAIIQSACMLNFRELVVALDYLTLPRGDPESASPLIARETLTQYLQQHPVRGAARLRAALEISRVGAESRMESLQHFELARMGLDNLEMQANIYTETGKWIGRFDLVDRKNKRIIEYDGEQHRTDRAQYLRDEKRLEQARQAGWIILRLHKEDLSDAALGATRKRVCEFLGYSPVPVAKHLVGFFSEPLHSKGADTLCGRRSMPV